MQQRRERGAHHRREGEEGGRAVAADIRSIRNEKKKMKASGASATTHISGEP
jgi:hypothetical protein